MHTLKYFDILISFTPFAYVTRVHASHTSHLVEGPQVVQLHHLRVNPGGEDETLWIKGAHRLPLQVHQALRVGCTVHRQAPLHINCKS